MRDQELPLGFLGESAHERLTTRQQELARAHVARMEALDKARQDRISKSVDRMRDERYEQTFTRVYDSLKGLTNDDVAQEMLAPRTRPSRYAPAPKKRSSLIFGVERPELFAHTFLLFS